MQHAGRLHSQQQHGESQRLSSMEVFHACYIWQLLVITAKEMLQGVVVTLHNTSLINEFWKNAKNTLLSSSSLTLWAIFTYNFEQYRDNWVRTLCRVVFCPGQKRRNLISARAGGACVEHAEGMTWQRGSHSNVTRTLYYWVCRILNK